MSFEYATRAAQGARNYQEDAVAVSGDPVALTVVLADGMGGHAGGAVASALACAAFVHAFCEPAPCEAAGDDVGVRLAAALEHANAAIRERAAGSPQLAGMGCTLIGAAFLPERFEWISVGDSPLYLVRRGGITRLNADHSLAPEIDRLAEIGRISREAAHADPRRHILRSALTGTEIDLIDRPRTPLPLEPGDAVVLASDGIHTLPEAEIGRLVAAAETPDAAASALLAAVASAGDRHQDNTTVVVVRVLPDVEDAGAPREAAP